MCARDFLLLGEAGVCGHQGIRLQVGTHWGSEFLKVFSFSKQKCGTGSEKAASRGQKLGSRLLIDGLVLVMSLPKEAVLCIVITQVITLSKPTAL